MTDHQQRPLSSTPVIKKFLKPNGWLIMACAFVLVAAFENCSQGSHGGSSTAVTNSTDSSSDAPTATPAPLTISPALENVVEGTTVQFTATGGSGAYAFFISSGGGQIDSDSGSFIAPAAGATVKVAVKDSLGSTSYAILMITTASSLTALNGTTTKVIATSYSALGKFNGGCNPTTPYGDACNMAIHQYCQSQQYQTGWGPLEHAGGTVAVACVMAGQADYKYVQFSTLTSLVSGCTNSSAVGLYCESAMFRYCKSEHYNVGFGPIGHDQNQILLTCMFAPAAVALQVNFSDLTAKQPSCSNSDTMSDSCLSAVHRYCRSQNYVTGTWILESNSTNGTATIGCMQ